MKPDEKRYAMNRVREEAILKEQEIRKKFTKKAKSLTAKEKIRLIRDGDVELIYPSSKIKESTLVIDAFSFEGVEASEEFDRKGFNKAITPLRRRRDKVLDLIMLGDSEKALKEIASFCGTLE